MVDRYRNRGLGVGSFWAMKTAINYGVWALAAKLSVLIPDIGKFIGIGLVGYVKLNTAMFASAFVALIRGRGMDINLGRHYGIIPYLSFSCR